MNNRFRLIRKVTQRTGEKENTPAEVRAKAAEGSFASVARTDIGLVRRSNQDSLIEAGALVGVADGMGGHQGGETASALARDALIAALKDAVPGPEALEAGIRDANAAVYRRAEEEESLHGMGTTLTVLWLGSREAYVGQVGDSRCYRYADGALAQITDDHSMVMEMARAGVITVEEAASHPMRNVITRAVGTDETVEPDLFVLPRAKDDLWLVCSDGLHGMIGDEDIAAVLASGDPDDVKADKLLAAALMGGGHDNVSLVLLRDLTGGEVSA